LSLASRIVNVERQVDTIEEKLQNFLDMYLEDRKKILAIALSTENLMGSSVCYF
jgi:potassium voltage-gated channel KQT-like subfamily protein